jgi:putative endonuclease
LGVGEYRRRLGSAGEDAAADWYRGAGYEVLDRNWRCVAGEIDLVCRQGQVIVVCEVKTRRGTAYGTPAEAVTPAKQARLRRLAARWLAEHGVGCREVRFDAVAVMGATVEVFQGAW